MKTQRLCQRFNDPREGRLGAVAGGPLFRTFCTFINDTLSRHLIMV